MTTDLAADETTSFARIIESVLKQLRFRAAGGAFDVELYTTLITQHGVAAVRNILENSNFGVDGRFGMGDLADVPFIRVFLNDGSKQSAQRSYYVVYLFAKDGSCCYLSLNQGTENLHGGAKALTKRALDMRTVVGAQPDLEPAIDLRSTNARPKKYEAGSAYAIAYRVGEPMTDARLKVDLERMLELLDKTAKSGLHFNPEFEPIHLLFKWNSDANMRTIEDHRTLAESQGSVWWGHFANATASNVSVAKISEIQKQLDSGVSTYAFLHRRGETWRTRVLEVTNEREKVRVDPRFPSYYKPEACNFFVLLSDFELLADDWVYDNLVLASDPDPTKIAGALGNQTTPLFVYQRHDPTSSAPEVTTSPATPPAEPIREPLTKDRLIQKTLLDEELINEILEALQGSFPQIALAGPPGTGKSHVAELLARYVTQTERNYRILQFHPSYTYEEFIEGLRPVANHGAINFQLVDGAVLDIVKKMDDGEPRVLVLDEMNRANLPRVFGELMYLMEKRGKPLDLLYSKDFVLPKELMFIGTMNTADRSIRSIDVALRRRFAIFELFPSADVLRRYYDSRTEPRTNHVPDLFGGFERLNQKLLAELDRHHTIGHTFFMRESFDHRKLRQVWERQLMPLLEEFFFDRPDDVAAFNPQEFWPSLPDAD